MCCPFLPSAGHVRTQNNAYCFIHGCYVKLRAPARTEVQIAEVAAVSRAMAEDIDFIRQYVDESKTSLDRLESAIFTLKELADQHLDERADRGHLRCRGLCRLQSEMSFGKNMRDRAAVLLSVKIDATWPPYVPTHFIAQSATTSPVKSGCSATAQSRMLFGPKLTVSQACTSPCGSILKNMKATNVQTRRRCTWQNDAGRLPVRLCCVQLLAMDWRA